MYVTNIKFRVRALQLGYYVGGLDTPVEHSVFPQANVLHSLLRSFILWSASMPDISSGGNRDHAFLFIGVCLAPSPESNP